MWTVVADGDEYVITDHNDDEQARLPANGGISTDDVKQVMHDRCSELKDQIRQNSDNQPLPVGDIMEWATIIEDLAGDQIQLPQPEDGQP